jgi:predicted amidophosphoribosyltransferase
MIDLAYMIESADVRIPNACPELPDMENEQVSESGLRACKGCGKVMIVKDLRIRLCAECRRKRDDHTAICEVCGKPFRRSGNCKGRSCMACRTADFTWKPREFTTENVREATREAMRHGISYGKYMQMIRRRTK